MVDRSRSILDISSQGLGRALTPVEKDRISTDASLAWGDAIMWAIVAVVGLLIVVMRALLRQATTLRTDMGAVI